MSILEQKTFISHIPPFDKLQEPELKTVVDAMDIAYFRKGEYLSISEQGLQHLLKRFLPHDLKYPTP